MQAFLGAAYVNDFSFQNRSWQVNIQADPQYRTRVEDIGNLEVRNTAGHIVPLRTLINVKNISGPSIVNRYNQYPSAELNGAAAPGVSSGQAISTMEAIASTSLPATMGYAWTELTYQQILASQDLFTKLAFPLGVAVFSGMLGVTVFGIFFTPVFYSVIMWMSERRAPSAAGRDARK
ncbi:MAG: efflux RND transporter permease subunit [Pirellulaceae bacterium]